MGKIQLSELLVELRRELEESQQQAAQERLKFKLEDIELELCVGATKTGEVKGGVKFWVYDAEAKGTISGESMQTIRLKLTPVSEGGGDTFISDRDRK